MIPSLFVWSLRCLSSGTCTCLVIKVNNLCRHFPNLIELRLLFSIALAFYFLQTSCVSKLTSIFTKKGLKIKIKILNKRKKHFSVIMALWWTAFALVPYYALWRAIAVHNIIFTEKSCLMLKWYKSSYKVIVLFSTKAFVKIKLKCGKTFIEGKKPRKG